MIWICLKIFLTTLLHHNSHPIQNYGTHYLTCLLSVIYYCVNEWNIIVGLDSQSVISSAYTIQYTHRYQRVCIICTVWGYLRLIRSNPVLFTQSEAVGTNKYFNVFQTFIVNLYPDQRCSELNYSKWQWISAPKIVSGVRMA